MKEIQSKSGNAQNIKHAMKTSMFLILIRIMHTGVQENGNGKQYTPEDGGSEQRPARKRKPKVLYEVQFVLLISSATSAILGQVKISVLISRNLFPPAMTNCILPSNHTNQHGCFIMDCTILY